MGKKRISNGDGAAPRSNSRSARKEPYNSDRLNQVVERLREQANRAAALARLMDETEITEVEVDGHAMLLRGLNQVDNFADNAQRAIREAKTEIEPI